MVLGTFTCPVIGQKTCGQGHITDVDVVYMFRSSNKTLVREPRYRLVQLSHNNCPKGSQSVGDHGQSMIPIPTAAPVGPPPVSRHSVPEAAAPGFIESKLGNLARSIFGGPPGPN